jgi:hypothetical protein
LAWKWPWNVTPKATNVSGLARCRGSCRAHRDRRIGNDAVLDSAQHQVSLPRCTDLCSIDPYRCGKLRKGS